MLDRQCGETRCPPTMGVGPEHVPLVPMNPRLIGTSAQLQSEVRNS